MDSSVHTVEINIEDTVTKSVKFSPESATITREIADVEIKVRSIF